MKVTASLKNLAVSPRKVRLVAVSIRGLSTDRAALELERQLKRSSKPMLKLLKSAVANAVNNHQIAEDNLRVAEVRVGEGQKLKRWLPRAQGRATPLWKRMSNVDLFLEEIVANQPARRKKKKAEAEPVSNETGTPDTKETKTAPKKEKAEKKEAPSA